ncbi:MAG: D-alanyl-D-alanine dipeptidase [Bacteroides sp. 43_108]|nr:MAG: D-alanyl-D-alanine dipeptidase [Bacteroides sp. 43_108]
MNRNIFINLLCLTMCLFSASQSYAQQKTLSKTAVSIKQQGYVDVQDEDPTIKVSLMYSRPDNFTGKILYKDLKEAFLHPQAAKALAKAQKELKRLRPDLSLIVFDAARPMSIQQQMWDVVKGTSKNIYVSNPANGGGLHNYGFAVDVSICDEKGDTIPMGTLIDHMGKEAHPEYETSMLAKGKISKEAVNNRKLLRRVMSAGGFRVLKTEWWHFNLKTRAQVKAEKRKPIR